MQDALADAMKLSRVLRSWLLRGPRGPAGRCAGPHREKPTCSSPPFTPPALKGWCGTHVGRARCHWRRFRAPARCRSETGAPLSRHPALRGTRRDERGLGFCADAALRAAVPTWLRRRSLAAVLSLRLGSGPRRESSPTVGLLHRRGPTGRCAGPHRENCPEVGVPLPTGHLSQWGTRPGRSHPDGGVLHRRGPAGRCAGPHRENCPHDRALLHTLAGHEKDPALNVGMAQRHQRWFRAPARCRSEAPTGRTGRRS